MPRISVAAGSSAKASTSTVTSPPSSATALRAAVSASDSVLALDLVEVLAPPPRGARLGFAVYAAKPTRGHGQDAQRRRRPAGKRMRAAQRLAALGVST